jgi:molecular chaperone GrpE
MNDETLNFSENDTQKNNLEILPEDALGLCHKQLLGAEERYQRLSADFDNYRRRIDREKTRISWEARARVLRGSLELVDTIDRAAEALQNQKALLIDFEGIIQALKGIELLQKSATRFLEQQGVRSISQNTHFDPTLHEAISYTHDSNCAEGAIVEVFEKGYLLDEELLRPARVRVNELEPGT